jgi:hypothetical protein
MAAGDLVDLGNLRGHWDMVGESVQLDRLSANAGSLIICADRRPFRWERRRWPSSFDIDLDDFARLWRGDASQRGKTPTLQGAGERGTERWAARRLSVRPMQKPGRRRGSCNSMSRSNIRPVCDLRSAADSGSGCPGMSTPLSRAVPLHRCRKDRSWLLAREQPGSFARSITSRFRYSTPGIDTLLG